MKIYKKPKLMVLSFAANDVLCVGCANTTRGDEFWSMFDPTPGDNVLTRDDAITNHLFGSDPEEECGTPVYGYCKFTSTDPSIVFTS